MNRLFLDTGYIIALDASDDQNHAAAIRHWQGLAPTRPRLVTTSYILDEAVTFFNSRGFHAKAIQVGTRLLSSSSVHLVHVQEAEFFAAWDYLKQRGDKTYSLTDCVSFIVMEQLGIKSALAFDRHFKQAGFQKLP